MRFDSTLISTFFLASAVLADLSREHHSSQFLDVVERFPPSSYAGAFSTTFAPYSYVAGNITVPSFKGGDGQIYILIGLDHGPGETCGATFGAGVMCTVTSNGTSYEVFSRWDPSPIEIFTDFDVSPGDIVQVIVAVSNPTTGYATVEIVGGQNTGAEKTKPFSSQGTLCLRSAWWAVQGSSNGGFPLFDNITIAQPMTYGQDNMEHDAGSSSVYDIISDSGQPLVTVQAYMDLIQVEDIRPH